MKLPDLQLLIMELKHFASSIMGHRGSVLTPILTTMLSVDFPTSCKCIS